MTARIRFTTPLRRDDHDIILALRAEAELVIKRLTEIIEQFGNATIGDLHDLVGLPTTHIDHKWGWTVLKDANIQQIPEGYLIELPEAEPI